MKNSNKSILKARLKLKSYINITTTPIEILDLKLDELAVDLNKDNRHKYQFTNKPIVSRIIGPGAGVRATDVMQGVLAIYRHFRNTEVKTLRDVFTIYSIEELLDIVPNFGEIRAVHLYKFIENIDYKIKLYIEGDK